MTRIIKGIKLYKIGYGGIGIGSLSDGKKVLVKGGALPGSIVDIRVVKQKKDYIEGHILQTVKYDPDFADGEVFCPHYLIPLGASKENVDSEKIGCGGCKWQIMSYKKQLELKQAIVDEAFTKIRKFQELIVLPIIGSPLEKGYRNKIEFSFGVFKTHSKEYRNLVKEKKTDEEIATLGVEKYSINSDRNLGFHKQGEFSKIVDIESCGLISEKANQIFEYVKKLCKESGLPVYDQKTHQGVFRHLVIREGQNTGQLLVNLSLSENNIKEHGDGLWEQFLEVLKKDAFLKEHVTSFVITYNNGLADTVKNSESETKTFWGDGYLHDILDFSQENVLGNLKEDQQEHMKVTFRISPFSFFQTNTLGAQRLFGTAMKMAGEVKGNILDLYCGAGSIGLSFLKMGMGESLIGIEIVEEAIVDAWHNAKINGVDEKCLFVASPCEKVFEKFPGIREKIQNTGLLIVDPPREGLHKNVIDFISQLKKEQNFTLLYISCNPITMARDIELLVKEGFRIKEIQPVDMFPQTHHVECIGVLE